jgi:hypothetical protein
MNYANIGKQIRKKSKCCFVSRIAALVLLRETSNMPNDYLPSVSPDFSVVVIETGIDRAIDEA